MSYPHFIILFIAFVKTNIIQLDQSNQQYNEDIQIQIAYQNSGLGFEYGMWTKYQPLADINQLGDIIPTSTDCSLFHYIAISNIEQLIYYLCFNNELKKIEHSVQLISYNRLKITQTLAIENDYHYEGTWLYYHLACIPQQKKFIIFIGTLDQINISFQEYNDYLPFKDDQLTFYYGNCREVINDQFKPLTLASFRGSIILNTISQDLVRDSMHFTKEEIIQLWQEKGDQYVFQNSFQYYVFDSQIEISQEYDKQFENKHIMLDSYLVQAWFKVQGILEEGKYQFFNMKSNIIQPQYLTISNIIQTSLSYYRPNQHTYQILFDTYSYTFCNINSFESSVLKISELITLQNSFYNWQFIFIKFVNDLMTISVTQNIEFSKTYDIRQYTGQYFKILLGSQFINKNTKLYIYDIYTSFRKTTILNYNFKLTCDSSCYTCSGPTKYECKSCFTQGCENCNLTNCPSACRIYKSDSKSCVCHIGYYDYNSKACYGISYLGYELQINDISLPTKNCDPNYYLLNEECIRCPEISNEYIKCCNACGNSNQWNFFCPAQLISIDGDPNNNFEIQGLSYNIYISLNQEHILCEFCSYRSSYPFQEYKYYHLGEPTYIYCIDNYIYFNKQCILSIRIKEIFDNISNSISQCSDPISTYLSLFNLNECLPCLIENCKYCFDYSQFNNKINSYQQNLDQLNYDDIVTGCALCYPGYVYNVKTRACEIQYQPEYCKLAILNTIGETVCLTSYNREIEAISYTECQDLVEYCQECMIIPEGNICIFCQFGYYFDYFVNSCLKIADAKVFQDISYINEVQNFYYYLTKTLLKQLNNDSNRKTCKIGYSITSDNKCEQDQPSICMEQYEADLYKFECKRYFPSIYGVFQKTSIQIDPLSEFEPIINCTNYCRSCRYDAQIQQLNTYYKGTQSMKCQLSYNNMKIANDYGRVLFNPQTSCKDSHNIRCIHNTNSYPPYISRLLLIYQQDPETNILDNLSLHGYIYEYIIEEDILDDCLNSYTFTKDYLKQDILTLQELQLIIKSKDYHQFKIGKPFLQITSLINNIIELQNLIIQLNYPLNYLFKSQNVILKFVNISFEGQNINQDFVIEANSYKNIELTNLTFLNLHFLNNILFKYQTQDPITQQYFEIKLKNITFQNCTFQNFSFIELDPIAYQVNLIIDQIKFINVQFIDSLFINSNDQQNQQNIQMQDLNFVNCLFYKTSLIKVNLHVQLKMFQFDMAFTTINNSELIYFTSDTNLQSFHFNNCQFINNTKLFYVPFTSVELEFNVNFINFSFKLIQFSDTNFIYFKMNFQSALNVLLTQFDHQDIINTSLQEQKLYILVQLEKQIDNLEVNYNQKLTIQDFTFTQPQKYVNQKISFWNDCFTQLGISQKLLIFNKYLSLIQPFNILFSKMHLYYQFIILSK